MSAESHSPRARPCVLLASVTVAATVVTALLWVPAVIGDMTGPALPAGVQGPSAVDHVFFGLIVFAVAYVAAVVLGWPVAYLGLMFS